jgi:uncharacterized protein (DUF433 family)
MSKGMMRKDIREVPAYGIAEVKDYLRTPRKTIAYWSTEEPIIRLANTSPPRFSFMNLLECHVISAMRIKGVRFVRIRRAIENATRIYRTPHPLLDLLLQTDGVDIFCEELSGLVNLSEGPNWAMKPMLEAFLQRIEVEKSRPRRFFPFVEEKTPGEPKVIQIDPRIAFGRPVIAGTAITTAIIAARFGAREPVNSLAEEYGRTVEEIEEAIRWERRPMAA